ncbi:MAG: heparan-alpha-glucosaminide N-acetyltransferase [Pararhizobium sp.]
MDQESPSAAATRAVARPQAGSRRIVWIDVARGLAIVAMAIYHFSWDLQYFGYVTPPTIDIGGWKMFARADASSFIFLVGVSLVLAHGKGIRWRPFWIRMAQILAGAAAITLVTYFVTPNGFIFYGILHSIAVLSLIGLLFLRVPVILTLVAAAAVFLAPRYLTSPIFDYPLFWFTGLSENLPRSNDYVPLFPWAAPLLVGVAMARLGRSLGAFEWLRAHPPVDSAITRLLTLGGRHSLAVYLLHQPLLFGLVFLASQIVPAPPIDPEVGYMSSCQVHCSAEQAAPFCQSFCRCTMTSLENQSLFEPLNRGRIDVRNDPRIHAIAQQCSAKAAGESPKP